MSERKNASPANARPDLSEPRERNLPRPDSRRSQSSLRWSSRFDRAARDVRVASSTSRARTSRGQLEKRTVSNEA
jgi:hypothetical protein